MENHIQGQGMPWKNTSKELPNVGNARENHIQGIAKQRGHYGKAHPRNSMLFPPGIPGLELSHSHEIIPGSFPRFSGHSWE